MAWLAWSPMTDCIFCKIAGGEIPTDEVASSELSYAFPDMNPGAPSHFLVIPRDHIAGADQLEANHAEILLDMVSTAREAARKEGIDKSGYRLVFNVGPDAGQSVFHLHLHVLGGRSMEWPPG